MSTALELSLIEMTIPYKSTIVSKDIEKVK
jgi:hypothetical protein